MEADDEVCSTSSIVQESNASICSSLLLEAVPFPLGLPLGLPRAIDLENKKTTHIFNPFTWLSNCLHMWPLLQAVFGSISLNLPHFSSLFFEYEAWALHKASNQRLNSYMLRIT